MANFPGETFISGGCKYILGIGPNGNLRPFYLGPVIARAGWIGLGIAAVAVVAGLFIWAYCEEGEANASSEQ